MSDGVITHLLRAPTVGGSELETAAIVRCLPEFTHRIVYPRRFRFWQPTILGLLPAGTEVVTTTDPDRAVRECPAGVLHVQFPFVVVDRPVGHDTVLELTAPPRVDGVSSTRMMTLRCFSPALPRR